MDIGVFILLMFHAIMAALRDIFINRKLDKIIEHLGIDEEGYR